MPENVSSHTQGYAPDRLSAALDRTVARAHGLRLFNRPYHPYFAATDVATIASLALCFAVTRRFPGISFGAFVVEFAAMVGFYRGFLQLKKRVTGSASRSFLQDTVLFLLPAYALLNRALGHPLALAFDLTGVMFPLYVGIVRMGCFAGGCCYGVPSRYGVLYSPEIFKAEKGCRKFQPGNDPKTRVFPVQLVESAGQLALCAGLVRWFWLQPNSRGLVLPIYLLAYSVLRFFLDFARRASARPRIGPFSEAQVFCMATAAVAVIAIVWLSRWAGVSVA